MLLLRKSFRFSLGKMSWNVNMKNYFKKRKFEILWIYYFRKSLILLGSIEICLKVLYDFLNSIPIEVVSRDWLCGARFQQMWGHLCTKDFIPSLTLKEMDWIFDFLLIFHSSSKFSVILIVQIHIFTRSIPFVLVPKTSKAH